MTARLERELAELLGAFDGQFASTHWTVLTRPNKEFTSDCKGYAPNNPALLCVLVLSLVVQDLGNRRDKVVHPHVVHFEVIEIGKEDALGTSRFNPAGAQDRPYSTGVRNDVGLSPSTVVAYRDSNRRSGLV